MKKHVERLNQPKKVYHHKQVVLEPEVVAQREALTEKFYALKDNERIVLETPFADVKIRRNEETDKLTVIIHHKTDYPVKLGIATYGKKGIFDELYHRAVKQEEFMVGAPPLPIGDITQFIFSLTYDTSRDYDLPGRGPLQQGDLVRRSTLSIPELNVVMEDTPPPRLPELRGQQTYKQHPINTAKMPRTR